MKLSKYKLYSINWLYSNGFSVEDIATELGLKSETVQDHLNNCQHEVPDRSSLAVKSQPVKSSKNLMIRHTKEKQTNNVSIMTREASAFNDEMKKKINQQRIQQNCIFKPNPDQ